MEGCVLVGTTGGPGSLGALRLAAAVGQRLGLPVEVVSVVEPVHPLAADVPDALAATGVELTALGVEVQRRRVVTQLEEVGGDAPGWPLRVEVGPVAPTIASVAEEAGAALIVIGLRHHSEAAARLGRPTPLRLLNLSSVPVLAVPEETGRLPLEVVIAVDFSEFSVRAAHRAPAVAAPGARIHLTHVMWGETTDAAEGTEWLRTYRSGARRRLEEIADALRAAGAGEVQSHLLETGDDPPREILRLAGELGADLIVAGSHGAGFFDRLLLGSVTSKLMNAADCAVLLVPPTEEEAATASASASES